MDWTTLITCIMTSLTTISVAVLGLAQSKRAKETAEYKKLREQLESERQQKQESKEQEDAKRLEAIEKSLREMKSDVEGLKSDMHILTNSELANIMQQLSHLHTFQADNFAYMQSLSNVVLAIGESLNESDAVDKEDKEKMNNTIESHRKIEQAIYKKLYSIIT